MTKFSTLGPIAIALAGSLTLAACGDDSEEGGMGGMTSSGGSDGSGGSATGGSDGDDCETILEIAASTDELSSLVAAVEAAGLEDALGGDDLTVFAPTNDAFADLLGALDLELGDLSPDQLTPILTYHVAGTVIDSAAAISVAEGDGNFDTLGGNVKISGSASDGLVLDASEASANIVLDLVDIEACNGIVHVIDGVILPSMTDVVTTQDGFVGLATLIGAADSGATIAGVLDGPATGVNEDLDPGGFTLFAPNNDAVDGVDPVPDGAALDDILQYHVYAADNAVDAASALTLEMAAIEMLNGDEAVVDGGDGVTVTDTGDSASSVTIADIYTANGIIHVIDGVLLPASVTNP